MFLTSCEKKDMNAAPNSPDSTNDNIVVSFEHPETKQKYKIIQAYKLFNKYIDKLESNPNAVPKDVYQKEIIEPVYNDCFADAEYIHMIDSFLKEVPINLSEIVKVNEKIDEGEAEKIIKEALIKSSKSIPAEKETTVCVFPSTNANLPVMVTVGSGKIIVLYNKDYTEEILRASIVHEYHHSVWTDKYFNKKMSFSVLDNLIFEGKAVMFEKLVYPEVNFPQVYSTFDKRLWSKIEPDLHKYDFDRSLEILMGGNGIPYHYGYSEGYKMVKSFLDLNPNVKPEEWTAMSAKDIFEKGNYLENYK